MQSFRIPETRGTSPPPMPTPELERMGRGSGRSHTVVSVRAEIRPTQGASRTWYGASCYGAHTHKRKRILITTSQHGVEADITDIVTATTSTQATSYKGVHPASLYTYGVGVRWLSYGRHRTSTTARQVYARLGGGDLERKTKDTALLWLATLSKS
eukprot:scaffold234380_cov32-Tisochrysis_lutea.AAC.1